MARRRGVPALDRPVELWVSCRMTHVFALGHLMGRPGCGSLADHGVAALQGRLRGPTHGGWYARVGDGRAGRHLQDGLRARVRGAGRRQRHRRRPTRRPRAARGSPRGAAHPLLGRRPRDGRRGVGRVLDDARRLPRRQRQHAHRRGTASAADVLGDATLRQGRSDHQPGRARPRSRAHWRIPEHFDASWTPLLAYNADDPTHPFRPFGATIGHWLEWARLRCTCAQPSGRGARLAAGERRVAVRGRRARGLGGRRRGRVRLHRRLDRPSRRTRADALGGRRGHCPRPLPSTRRPATRRTPTGTAPGGSTSTPASAMSTAAPGATSCRPTTGRAAPPGRESPTSTTPSRPP